MKTLGEYSKDASDLIKLLEAHIIKNNLSLCAVASELGMSRQVLRRIIKRGSRLRYVSIIRIVNWINKQEHNSILS